MQKLPKLCDYFGTFWGGNLWKAYSRGEVYLSVGKSSVRARRSMLSRSSDPQTFMSLDFRVLRDCIERGEPYD